MAPKDYAGVRNNRSLMKKFRGEQLMYSEMVVKINQENKEQNRMLVITTDTMYNIKTSLMGGKKAQRKIPITKIDGVSKCPNEKNRTEFVIHVRSEYDYRFKSLKRKEIIDLLKWLYLNRMNKNLPIFDIPQIDLSSVTTTEKDKKRRNDRFPDDSYRNHDENLLKPAPARPVSLAILQNKSSMEADVKQEKIRPISESQPYNNAFQGPPLMSPEPKFGGSDMEFDSSANSRKGAFAAIGSAIKKLSPRSNNKQLEVQNEKISITMKNI